MTSGSGGEAWEDGEALDGDARDLGEVAGDDRGRHAPVLGDLDARAPVDGVVAVVDAAVSRVRPVSLGVLTTVLGVVPLLWDPFFKSLAVVIILAAIIAQFFQGYTQFEFGQYAMRGFLELIVPPVLLAALAIFLQVVFKQKML